MIGSNIAINNNSVAASSVRSPGTSALSTSWIKAGNRYRSCACRECAARAAHACADATLSKQAFILTR